MLLAISIAHGSNHGLTNREVTAGDGFELGASEQITEDLYGIHVT